MKIGRKLKNSEDGKIGNRKVKRWENIEREE